MNVCMQSANFRSFGLTKIYCYLLCNKVKNIPLLLNNEKYIIQVKNMFYNNSKEYFKKYNDLEPSYFENESEFKN